MNAEQTEYELVAHQGAMVTVVRPGYGKQSDSFVGRLTVVNDNYPPRFQVANELYATIFMSDDVVSFSSKKKDDGEYEVIIRLKGPTDYSKMPMMDWGPRLKA